MIVEIRQARTSDARAIVPLLRPRDLEGLGAAGDPVDVILMALTHSTVAFTATADGEVAVMWGLRNAVLLDDRVYLWMLGTTIIDAHPVHFLRCSRAAVKILRESYSLVYGECAHDFVRSVRWLTWLGAKVWAPAPEQGGRLVFALEGFLSELGKNAHRPDGRPAARRAHRDVFVAGHVGGRHGA